MSADLHCHTVLSDGSATIEQTMRFAHNVGVSAIAITDHDTFAGVERAKELGAEYGIQVINGVEISSYDYKRNKKVHVLSYLPDRPEVLSDIMNSTLAQRRSSGLAAIEHLCKMFPLTKEEFLAYSECSTTIFKQHLMRALMDAGFADKVFSELYYDLFKRPGDKRIYTSVSYPDVNNVLKAVRDAGGIAVIAHAGFYGNFELIVELASQGAIDGVEVWHPENNAEQTQWLFDFANAHSLIKTGGSDFHGMNNSRMTHVGEYRTPKEELEKLLNYKK
ncbi:MAG: PHP domain-containing protein [Clostridia bacterium]|nr:PHP domain-containing protein [Clostridia bacterium]